MGDGSGPVSPFVYSSGDYLGRVISLSAPFDDNPANLATYMNLTGSATVHRDPACLYTKVIVGVPSGAHVTLPVPAGDSTYTLAQMATVGLTTATQLRSLNITAIP
jgi:hypothetical protein